MDPVWSIADYVEFLESFTYFHVAFLKRCFIIVLYLKTSNTKLKFEFCPAKMNIEMLQECTLVSKVPKYFLGAWNGIIS